MQQHHHNQPNAAILVGPARWNPWPVSIVAFFALAIIAFGIFIAFCNTHRADLVAPDYYEQEVRYQAQMERVQNAQPIAATAVSYNAAAKTILVSLPPSSGNAVTGTIQLYRPSEAALDRKLTLSLNPDGNQTIDASKLKPGLWKVRVSWTAARQDYYVDQKIVIGEGS